MAKNFTTQLDPRQAAIMSALKDKLIINLLNRLDGSEARVSVEDLEDSAEYSLVTFVDEKSNEIVFRANKNEPKKKDESPIIVGEKKILHPL